MKHIILIWSLFFSALAQGAPATSVKGEAGNASFTQNIVLPNHQVTKQTGINSRFETGNKNLLVNPSFEHSTVSTGWTATNMGAASATTTGLQDGASAMFITSSSTSWSVYQDVTLFAAGKVGQEAEASIWVDSLTSNANIWVCPRINGVSVTASVANGCVQYTNLGIPQKLTVYMLYGSTSTGIEIKGANNSTSVILDDAYLGDRRNLVTGITTTPRTLYVPTSPNSSIGLSSTECYYERVGGNLFGDCTFTASINSASEARVSFPSGTTATTFTNLKPVGYANRNNSANAANNFAVYVESGVSYFTFGLLNTSGTGAHVKQNASSIFANGDVIKFKVGPVAIAEWQGDTNAFTTKCDDLKSCREQFDVEVTTTSGATAKETLDFIASCTAATASVCTFTSGYFTVAPTCSSGNVLGSSVQAAHVYNVTSSGFTVEGWNTSTGAAATSVSIPVTCKKTGVDLDNARLTQQIIQMRDVPTTPGSVKPKTAWAKFTSAGVLSWQYGNVLTSNCSLSSGLYTCPFAASSWTGNPPACSAIPDGSGTAVDVMVSHANNPTTTSNTYFKFYDSTGANKTDQAFEVTCHGIAP